MMLCPIIYCYIEGSQRKFRISNISNVRLSRHLPVKESFGYCDGRFLRLTTPITKYKSLAKILSWTHEQPRNLTNLFGHRRVLPAFFSWAANKKSQFVIWPEAPNK